jgi:hypothetical protein
VCEIGQLNASKMWTLLAMAEQIHILNAVNDDGDGLIVSFSDGTTAGYVVEELLALRPYREPTHELNSRSLPQRPATQF